MKTFVAATVLALSALPSLAQQSSVASYYPQQDRLGREAVVQAPVITVGATVAYYPHVDRSGDVAVLDRSAAAPEGRAVAVSSLSYYPHIDRIGDTIQAQPAAPATTLTRAIRGGKAS